MRHPSTYLILSLLVGLLLSCQGGSTHRMPPSSPRNADSAACLVTDSFSEAHSGEYGHFSVVIDYPVSGPTAGVKSIRDYIKRLLFEHQTSCVPDSPSLMVREYIAGRRAHYAKTLSQMRLSHVDSNEAPEEGFEIRYLFGNERFASYEIYHYSYITGAAHGEYTEYGISFRLSDGHILTTSDLLKPIDDNFYSLIREGMKSYFHVSTDAELESICHIDLRLKPMPTFGPYLVGDGVRFHYSIYDVCPFDYGDPSFTIPYNKIKPYLTDTALKMIGY